jgi:hypothetical protein
MRIYWYMLTWIFIYTSKGWRDGGTSFKITDINNFVSSILFRRFKLRNLSSFQRLLNLHGFRRSSATERCVCVYICVYVFTHIRIFIYIYIDTCIYEFILFSTVIEFKWFQVCICIGIDTCICMYVCAFEGWNNIHTSTCVCILYIYLLSYLYIEMNLHMSITIWIFRFFLHKYFCKKNSLFYKQRCIFSSRFPAWKKRNGFTN